VDYPGVYVEELPTGIRPIEGVPTSIALFVGWTARGPVDRAVELSCFAEYERHFGGPEPRAWLGYAVRHFFLNGGEKALVIRIASEGAKPAGARIGGLTVEASSSGGWGNGLWIERTETGATFRLDVRDGGAEGPVLESFADLSSAEADFRFAPAIINGESSLLTGAAIDSGPSDAAAAGRLEGGEDGEPLASDDDAFVAALAPLFESGGAADQVDLFNLLCVPGLTRTDAVTMLQTHARARRAFLIVDCAEDAAVSDLEAGVPLRGADASHSAFYFPWVIAPDPAQSNAVRAFPPSGCVAGVYARTDKVRGVWKPPAGVEALLQDVLGLAVSLSDAENGRLNPKAVNCLRTMPVYGSIVWGARTLAGDDGAGSDWKYVPVRRVASFIEESLHRGTQWVVFEPNGEPLWERIRLNVGSFMHALFGQGAFQGQTPREAYFVKCDRETTTQDDVNLGRVNILVGFAPLKPAEFVVVRIQQMIRQADPDDDD